MLDIQDGFLKGTRDHIINIFRMLQLIYLNHGLEHLAAESSIRSLNHTESCMKGASQDQSAHVWPTGLCDLTPLWF